MGVQISPWAQKIRRMTFRLWEFNFPRPHQVKNTLNNIMKKFIIPILIFIVVIAVITGYIFLRKEEQKSTSLETIIKACDKEQSIINMRILPSCYLREMLTHLKYSKKETFDYCQKNWKFCEEDIEIAYSSLGRDYENLCRQTIFENKDYNKIAGDIKPCILDKLISNNKITNEEALDYCKDRKNAIYGYGEGTCEEKIKELKNYRTKYLE